MTSKLSKVKKLALFAAIGIIAIGCGSPEQKKAKHIKKGDSYLAEGRVREATIEYKNAVQIAPGDPEGHYKLGLIY
jgi:Tfp pilus assembly protein PilF